MLTAHRKQQEKGASSCKKRFLSDRPLKLHLTDINIILVFSLYSPPQSYEAYFKCQCVPFRKQGTFIRKAIKELLEDESQATVKHQLKGDGTMLLKAYNVLL